MHSYIYFRRELDFLKRLHYLSVGDYSILDQYLPILVDDENNNIPIVAPKDLFSGSGEELDIPTLVATLSMNKINRLFKRVLLQIVAKDISVRVSGKALLNLEGFLSSKEMRYIFAEVPTQESGINQVLVKYPALAILEHFKYVYFKSATLSNCSERFKLDSPNMEILPIAESLDIAEQVETAISRILPASKNLITNFRIV